MDLRAIAYKNEPHPGSDPPQISCSFDMLDPLYPKDKVQKKKF